MRGWHVQPLTGWLADSLGSYVERDESGRFVLVHYLLKRGASHGVAAVRGDHLDHHPADQRRALHRGMRLEGKGQSAREDCVVCKFL